MTKLNPGDSVICLLKESAIINPYLSDYDEIKSFDIVAKDNVGYYLFVPPYMFLKGIFKVDSVILNKLKLHKKYLNDYLVFISESQIFKIKSQFDGCFCVRCSNFSEMSEPNQDNGDFICWTCRDNPY